MLTLTPARRQVSVTCHLVCPDLYYLILNVANFKTCNEIITNQIHRIADYFKKRITIKCLNCVILANVERFRKHSLL